MVAVAPGSPGRCQASSYRAASSPARRRFSCAAAHYEAGDEYCSRADGCTSHRREVGAHQLAFAASEAAHGTTETRSSTGTRRDVVGFGHRIFVAGSAQRGVRAVADGVRTLPRMARRRPLAADSGSAPAPPMMQTAHSRDRSGTVGLGRVCKVVLGCVTQQPSVASWSHLQLAASIDVLISDGDRGYRSGDASEGGVLPPQAAGTWSHSSKLRARSDPGSLRRIPRRGPDPSG
jgi:hypothetical protein